MFLKIVSLLFSTLLIAGCGIEEVKQDEKKIVNSNHDVPKEPEKITAIPFKASSVEYKIVPLDEPNSYAIDVSWNKTDMLVFLRQVPEKNFTKVNKDKQLHRFSVKGGSNNKIEIESRESDSGSLMDHLTLEIVIPEDLVINKTYSLSGNVKKECGRLFFRQGAIMQLYNFNLELNCDELISEDGQIETFPENMSATKKGADGRDGGTAKLRFRKARGKISIHLKGEDGANGRDGLLGFQTREFHFKGCRSQNGGKGGSTGNVYIEVEQPSQLNVKSTLNPGLGGKPGQMVGLINGNKDGELSDTSCISGDSEGTKGSPGNIGESCFKISTEPPNCEL